MMIVMTILQYEELNRVTILNDFDIMTDNKGSMTSNVAETSLFSDSLNANIGYLYFAIPSKF